MDAFAYHATVAFAVAVALGQQVVGGWAWLRGHRPHLERKLPTLAGEWVLRFMGYALLVRGLQQGAVPWVPTYARLLGIPLMVTGLVIALVAQHQLGDLWYGGVAIYQGHEIRDTGLYGRVRHPLYAGLILGYIGIVVLIPNRWVVYSMAVLSLVLAVRILREETALIRHFGADSKSAKHYRRRHPGKQRPNPYKAYCQQVPAIVPFRVSRLLRRRRE